MEGLDRFINYDEFKRLRLQEMRVFLRIVEQDSFKYVFNWWEKLLIPKRVKEQLLGYEGIINDVVNNVHNSKILFPMADNIQMSMETYIPSSQYWTLTRNHAKALNDLATVRKDLALDE